MWVKVKTLSPDDLDQLNQTLGKMMRTIELEGGSYRDLHICPVCEHVNYASDCEHSIDVVISE